MSLNRHTAAGSNAGFNYQFERALYWLASSPAGATIGIETDDDVAVRGANKSQLLEQDKHSIQAEATPFADRSKDLWNTLAIWIEALDSKEVAGDAANFLMVTNKLLPDCIAKKIGQAETKTQIDECVAALEKAGQNPPEHIRHQVERVLRPASSETLRSVISKCDLIDASQASTGPQLRKETVAQLQLPESCLTAADSITDELLGWLHKTALAAWQQNQPAWIERNHFVNQLHAIIDLRKRQITRERAEHLIPVTDEKVGREKGSHFVKQLHLVTDDDGVVDISKVRQKRKFLENSSNALAAQRQRVRQIYLFVGRVEQALENVSASRNVDKLREQVKALSDKIAELKKHLDPLKQRDRINAAVDKVSAKIADYARLLKLEHATENVRLNTRELTLQFKPLSGRTDFLWEVGSGQNWVGYHVAGLLALHEHFISLNQNPVPRFLVIDQPSQVYFPEAWPTMESAPGEPSKPDGSSDIDGVRRIFSALSNFFDAVAGQFQIIVTEHAGSITWDGIPNVHLVGNWRQGHDEFLVPAAWLKGEGKS